MLCCPDDAARGSRALAADAGTRFIDASTAQPVKSRTGPLDLPNFPKASRAASLCTSSSSNPGCYFNRCSVALIAVRLVAAKLLPADYPAGPFNGVSGLYRRRQTV